MSEAAAAGPPPPILVIAPPGAPGQTVAAALGRGPRSFDLPPLNLEVEGTLYDMTFEMTGLRAAQMHGLLRSLSLLLGGEQSMGAVEMARRWTLERLHLPGRAVAETLLSRIAPRRAVIAMGPGFMDEVQRRRLPELYPGADLVLVHPDPQAQDAALRAEAADAAAALLTGAGSEDPANWRPDGEQLRSMTDAAMEETAGLFAPQGGRRADLDAVDLDADPRAALSRLARALGLPDDPEALSAMMRPEASPFAGPGPYGAHLEGRISALARI